MYLNKSNDVELNYRTKLRLDTQFFISLLCPDALSFSTFFPLTMLPVPRFAPTLCRPQDSSR